MDNACKLISFKIICRTCGSNNIKLESCMEDSDLLEITCMECGEEEMIDIF